MTTQTKTLIATSLVLSIAVGFETRQFSQQREKSSSLTQKAGMLEVQLQQIRREHDRILSAIEHTQNAIKAAQPLAKYTTTDSELGIWLDRVNHLKQWLQVFPEKSIPEMQFLSSNDWLSVTLDNPLGTDAQIRDALSKLRSLAKLKPQVAENLAAALQAYCKANNGAFPSDPIQLRPYLNSSLPDDILRRYEPAPEVAGKNDANGVILDGLHLTGSGRVVLQERASVDEDYDTWIGFMRKGGWGMIGVSQIAKTTDQAARAFNKANNGQEPSTPEQLLPFISTPVDPVRLKEYWEVSHHR